MAEENKLSSGFCSPFQCSPCCPSDRITVKLQTDQPVVPVPVYQDILRRDKYVEVPQVALKDQVVPTVYTQETVHDVPQMGVTYAESAVNVESYKYVDKTVSVPVSMGYAPKFVPKWDVREIPRPVPKYEGEQKIVQVEVPTVRYVNKYVDKEIVVDVKEKIVPKIVEVEKPVEVVKYQWKEEQQDVPVYKYVPKFDVELECPPPLIVPFPETKVFKDPSIEQSLSYNCYSFCQQNLCDCCTSTDGNIGLPQQNVDPNQMYVPTDIPEGMPLYPLPTPQEGTAAETSETAGAGKTGGWFDAFSGYLPEQFSPSDGYPQGMPRDFAEYFREKAVSSKKSPPPTEVPAGPMQPNELEPTVEYKGSVKKPSVYGGELDPITFKLHAIEIHQFIMLPNLGVPQFVQTLPEVDVSTNRSILESFFGPVPDGWADPGITGMPAPIMSDILQGNYPVKKHTTTQLTQTFDVSVDKEAKEAVYEGEVGNGEVNSEDVIPQVFYEAAEGEEDV